MASLQVKNMPLDMGIGNREFLPPRDSESAAVSQWGDMAPECMELLNGFDIGEPTAAPGDNAPIWGPSPGVTAHVIDSQYQASGAQMAILALKKTNSSAATAKQQGVATKASKKKRVIKKQPPSAPAPTINQRCVSPRDVSPPPPNRDAPVKKGAASKKMTAATMDPETLADKRARNKIAAEKCRRKRLAKVALTEAENLDLKVRVETLQTQLTKIKASMRQVIADTEGGKRNHEGVPAMLMNILMEL